jgi:hypothetical protein
MIIQHWRELAKHTERLPPEGHEPQAHQIGLLRTKTYGFSLHGLHPDERRTGKTAKLIDLYARINRVNLTIKAI